MRVATWNVNSIRSRLNQVGQWLESTQPTIDILCIQETKVIDSDFPRQELERLGYQVTVYGQKSYNGVALLSRAPLDSIQMGFGAVLDASLVGDLDDQKRVIAATCQGIRIINVYVPNGSEVGSDKYAYKLRWLNALKAYLAVQLADPAPLLIGGDFNIALEDRDLYDPKKKGEIMASEPERQSLAAILSLGLQDAFRKFTPDPGHYSWWDYRAGSFQRNRGWRIDHLYLNESLYALAQRCVIDVDPRKAEKPSDHTPVIVDLAPVIVDLAIK